MNTLPDPRRYPPRGAPDRLLELARSSLATGDPIARSVHNDVLLSAIRVCHAAGDEAVVATALAAASSAEEYACLAQRAAEAAEVPLTTGEIGARLFALPLVVVAGGREGATLGGALPDIDAVTALLSEHSALGDVQRYSLGNALCAVERIEAIAPAELARADVDTLARLTPGFEPAPIVLPSADESVHLRFLVGVAWVSSEAKRWIGPRDPVGKWAVPLTHAVAAQMAQPNVTVLPLPRPPLPLAQAAAAGRAAAAEIAFQLFVGGALRRARAGVGEPTVIVAAHRADDSVAGATGEVRVTFSSPFDDAMCEAWRWPLGPADDIGAISTAITGLLAECRVDGVVLVPEVQPDRHPARPHERLLLTHAHLDAGDGGSAQARTSSH
ncbi:MAG: hypothetical protein IOD10_01055 [Rhodocyclaceae bacterium]|nr:hypothetical protein [Rhodocyclaceae bacterium]